MQAARVVIEHVGDVDTGRRHLRGGLDQRHNARRVLFPVRADTQVEQDVPGATGDEEAVYGRMEGSDARVGLRLHKERRVDQQERFALKRFRRDFSGLASP